MLITEPEPRAHHSGPDQLHQAECAFQIDLDHFVELAFVEIERGTLRDIGGGVVDQDVDAPKSLSRDVDQILNLIEFADVASDRFDARANFLGDGVERLLFTARDDHLGAFAHEDFGDGSPDASARARYDRYFVVENHVLFFDAAFRFSMGFDGFLVGLVGMLQRLPGKFMAGLMILLAVLLGCFSVSMSREVMHLGCDLMGVFHTPRIARLFGMIFLLKRIASRGKRPSVARSYKVSVFKYARNSPPRS